MKTVVIYLVLGCYCAAGYEEDAILRSPNLIQKYGYPVEIHNVTTDDGYILAHHRIPYGRDGYTSNYRPVIILQHGFMGSSADWIIPGPEKALGYILADSGYDVWILNTRGNEYSNQHTHMSPYSSSYWDFSWHEIGTKDLPATIDYILLLTEQAKLYHIGHSQGTCSFYVLTSKLPHYSSKIKAHISYAPVALREHTQSMLYGIMATLERTGSFSFIRNTIGDFKFPPSTGIFRALSHLGCSDVSPTQPICSQIYFSMMGYNPQQLNKTLLPVIYGHFPAGASLKLFVHSAQLINSGRFAEFDYKTQNSRHYKTDAPPDYNLSAVNTPVYTFYGGADTISNPGDVERLHSMLPDFRQTKYLPTWAHMDFLYGVDAPKLVIEDTLGILKNCEHGEGCYMN